MTTTDYLISVMETLGFFNKFSKKHGLLKNVGMNLTRKVISLIPPYP